MQFYAILVGVRQPNTYLEIPVLENRWILSLIVSGLLLSITQNSAAGWDCQPAQNGGWVCQGVISPPSESERREPELPVKTATQRNGEPIQSAPPRKSDRRITTAEPSPVNQPVTTRQREQNSAASADDEKALATTISDTSADTEVPAKPQTGGDTASPIETAADEPKADLDPGEADPSGVAVAAEEAEPPPAIQMESTPEAKIENADTDSEVSGPIPSQEPIDQEEDAQLRQLPDQPPSDSTANRQSMEEPRIGDTLFAGPVSANIDRGLNWNQCYPWPRPAPLSFSPAPTQQMLIDADSAVLEQTKDQITLEGDVQVRGTESMMEADSAIYERTAETLDAKGNVYFERPGLRLTAAQAHFDLSSNQGDLKQVSYRLSDQGARGDADSAWIESRDLTHFKQIDYTTCKPGQNGWLLQADELDIDKASGVGTARHAKLRFKGVPFLYLPYASFPIDDRRKSGFLFPSIGESDRSGTDIAVPYYFNIAPNMDATFTPRIMSKRGLLLGGEFRYLQQKHQGRLRAEILPDDREVEDDAENTRGALAFESSGNPAPGWSFDVDINYVSDNNYLDDLGDSLAVTSTRHLERVGQVRYTGSDWSLLGKTQYYQTVDDTIQTSNRPYSRLPQLLFDLKKPRQTYGLTYHLRSEYVNFEHSDNDKIKGHRFDFQPAVTLPLIKRWGFLTPKASIRYTRYTLENQVAGVEDDPDRFLPTFSLDSGLFFERNGSWLGKAIVHTLEPRLFYLYTPKENQDDLPNFDTSDVTFSFASLFRENRFSGSDRVGDANQLTAALTSRILSDRTGAELLNLSIGQIFYFRDREVQRTTGAADTENSSSVVAELAAEIGWDWSLRSGIQWDPHASNDNVENGSFSLRYNDDSEKVFNAEYNYTRDSVEQTDLSARWPINNKWGVVGRWTYSHLFEETVQTFAGIEYDNCCWRVRLIGQQLLTDVEEEPVNSVLLQFQLKGLGGWGKADDSFLERNISGYQVNR